MWITHRRPVTFHRAALAIRVVGRQHLVRHHVQAGAGVALLVGPDAGSEGPGKGHTVTIGQSTQCGAGRGIEGDDIDEQVFAIVTGGAHAGYREGLSSLVCTLGGLSVQSAAINPSIMLVPYPAGRCSCWRMLQCLHMDALHLPGSYGVFSSKGRTARSTGATP